MRPDKTLFALIMLGALPSCYPPTQSSYSPTISEQPQPLHPSYGYGGSPVSVPPPPLTPPASLTLPPPCTVCNRTSTVIPNSWWP
jgi:hypothetical protein